MVRSTFRQHGVEIQEHVRNDRHGRRFGRFETSRQRTERLFGKCPGSGLVAAVAFQFVIVERAEDFRPFRRNVAGGGQFIAVRQPGVRVGAAFGQNAPGQSLRGFDENGVV